MSIIKAFNSHFIEFLDALTKTYGTDIYTPFKDLPESFQHTIFYGSGHKSINFYFERGTRRYTYQKPFEGVIPNLKRRYRETDSNYIREEIKQYMKSAYSQKKRCFSQQPMQKIDKKHSW